MATGHHLGHGIQLTVCIDLLGVSIKMQKPQGERLLDKVGAGAMIGLTLLSVGLLGYLICDQTKVKPIRTVIRRYEKTETFGGALETQFRNDFTAKAKRKKGVETIIKEIFGEDFFDIYLDETTAEDLYQFSYNPTKTLTPGLISAPNPGKTANATINSQQFRGKKEAVMPKPPDYYRIFITGGSFPYGLCAPSDERTVSGFLEKILNEKYSSGGKHFEVFNAACITWSSVKEREVIIDQISRFDPDLVINITGINDITFGANGLLVERQLPEGDRYFFRLIKKSHDLYSDKKLKWVAPEVSGQSLPPEEVAEKFVRNMKLAYIGLTGANPDAKFMIELQPVYQRTHKPLSQGEKRIRGLFRCESKREYIQECYAEYHRQLEDLLQTNPNMSYYDLSDVFDDIPQRVFIDTCHTGDRGNLAVAERISEQIGELLRKETELEYNKYMENICSDKSILADANQRIINRYEKSKRFKEILEDYKELLENAPPGGISLEEAARRLVR